MLKNIFINFNDNGKKRNLNKRVLALLLTLPLTLSVACNREREVTESTTATLLNSNVTSISKTEDSKKPGKNDRKKDSELALKTSKNQVSQSSSSTSNKAQGDSKNFNKSTTTKSANLTNKNNQETAKQTQANKPAKTTAAFKTQAQTQKAATTKATQRPTAKVTSRATQKTTAKPTPTRIPSPTPVPTTSTTAPTTKKETISVSLTISLQSLKTNPNALPEHQQKLLVPESGYLANGYNVEVKEGTTVLEVLKDYLNKNNIHYDIQDHQFGAYIAGINNIYEFDAGKNSGWMYKVNGVLPNYGVGSYKLKDGDSILLFYTVDYTK